MATGGAGEWGSRFCRRGGHRSGGKIGGTARPWGLHAAMAPSGGL